MKKELFAILIFCTLILCAIANLVHLNKLSEDILLYMDYTAMYCSLEDYSSANEELDKAMSLWSQADEYIHVFIRPTDTANLTEQFYDLRISLLDQEYSESLERIKKLEKNLRMIVESERLSFQSIF